MRSQSGFTLIESLIAVALIAIILSAAAAVASLLAQQTESARVLSERDRVLSNLLMMVRSQSAHQMPNFAHEYGINQFAFDNERLPIAWSPWFFGPVAECPDCIGRAGYVVRPIGNGGLYQVTVRIYNKKTEQQYPDFKFVMVAK